MDNEFIVCQICGKKMSQLGRHLKMKHDMTGYDYKQLFPNALLMSAVRRAKNTNKSISPNNIEFWLRKGLTETDALIKLMEHKRKVSINSKTKSPFSTEYWVEKGLSIEESKEKIRSNNVRDLQYFISMYGDIAGLEKYNLMIMKRSYSNSKKKLLDSGKSTFEVNELAKIRWNQTSLNSFVLRYGLEYGTIKYNNYCLNQRIKSKRHISYWLNQGLDISEAKLALHKFQSRSIMYWVDKFGEVLGTKKYDAWVALVKSKMNISGVSKSSQVFFKSFFEKINGASNVCYFEYNQREFKIVSSSGNNLFLDCYFEYNGKKFGIEYNGDYWHANPKIYQSDSLISYPSKKRYASDVWAKDEYKNNEFKKQDIHIFYVWENDVYLDLEKEICKIIYEIEKGNL